MIWEPILSGAQAEQAWSAILRIAEALKAYQPTSFSLASGSSGIALFAHQLSLAKPDAGYGEEAERFFSYATEALSDDISAANLYAGFSGVAMAGELMVPASLEEEDPYESIDEALTSFLDEDAWVYDYDLIVGLVGLGTYAVERAHRESSRTILHQVLHHLEATAREVPEGVTWWTSPTLMLPETAAQFPNGFYNFGLSHGVPGVLVLLARMLRAGFEGGRVKPLLERSVSWLLANQIKPQTAPPGVDPAHIGASHFPAYTFSKGDVMSCRTAWCYGDPGVAAALWIAGDVCQKEAWKAEALRLARLASSLSPQEAKIVDIAICHGASGLAHIWNRFYQQSKDETMRQNAIAWFGHTLKMFRDDGFAGVCEWKMLEGSNAFGFVPCEGFLTGAAGVGLVLLAGLAPHEPTWDRVLLLSDKT